MHLEVTTQHTTTQAAGQGTSMVTLRGPLTLDTKIAETQITTLLVGDTRVVVDVAGRGLAAAIVATSFRSALRPFLGQPLSLVEIATRVGQQHWEEGWEARRRYVTAIFVRLR